MIAEKPLFDSHHYNSFSFDRMFLKLGDNVDMDEILEKFENLLDRIIGLKLTSPWLLKKPLFDCHQHNLFSFVQIFLKLAHKADMDQISDNFQN